MSTKYWRVRHNGSLTGDSEWSDPTSFEPRLSFGEIGNLPQDASYGGVIWAQGFFIIYRADEDTIYKSSDGVNWSTITTGAVPFRTMAYSPLYGRLLAGGVAGGNAQCWFFSDDLGENWQTIGGYTPDSTTNTANQVIWAETFQQFYLYTNAGTSQTSRMGRSLDGQAFIADGTLAGNCVLNHVAGGTPPNDWLGRVIFMENGTSARNNETTNGTTYSLVTRNIVPEGTRVGTHTNGISYVGTSGVTSNYSVMRTLDGTTWERIPLTQSQPNCTSFAGISSNSVIGAGDAVLPTNSHLLLSEDQGATWAELDVPTRGINANSGGGNHVAYSPSLSKVIAVGFGGPTSGRAIIADA